MEYCRYHPLKAATFDCIDCEQTLCDHCVDHEARCLKCGAHTESLGEQHRVEPFWRRIEAAFRYPLNLRSGILIIGLAVVSGVLDFLPDFGFASLVAQIGLAGILLQYAFGCLEATAQGQMRVPDVGDAYQGGFGIMFQMLLLTLALFAAIWGVGYLLGPRAAGIAILLCIVSLPAILIRYGLSQDLLAALNPVQTLRLIVTIGLPYGVLILMIMVMSGSVSVVQQLTGQSWSFLSLVLQSLAANYYFIVTFHIMGYMIFQYQGRLGFTARADHGDDNERGDTDIWSARIGIRLKDGDYKRAFELFEEALKHHNRDKRFYAQYFECLYQLGEGDRLAGFATRYLTFVLHHGDASRLLTIVHQVRERVPDFVPDDPQLRLTIARQCQHQGEPRLAIQLINGLHKRYPQFGELPEAFDLMGQCLATLPGRQADADKCRRMAEKLAERRGGDAAPGKASPA